jgi:hypothetical protein
MGALVRPIPKRKISEDAMSQKNRMIIALEIAFVVLAGLYGAQLRIGPSCPKEGLGDK